MKVLRAGLLGLLATSVVGCSTAGPTQPAGSNPASTTAPIVDLPMKAHENELIAAKNPDGSYESQQIRLYGGRRYRFRRIIVSGFPYYVPYYYYPTVYSYYTPFYYRYDPYWYYVPAYYSPYFGSRYIIIRRPRTGNGGNGGGNGNGNGENNDD